MGNLHEKSRTYIYPDGQLLIVPYVRQLVVSSSGGHRLTTAGNGMVYVAPKWIAIEIESDHGWEM